MNRLAAVAFMVLAMAFAVACSEPGADPSPTGDEPSATATTAMQADDTTGESPATVETEPSGAAPTEASAEDPPPETAATATKVYFIHTDW